MMQALRRFEHHLQQHRRLTLAKASIDLDAKLQPPPESTSMLKFDGFLRLRRTSQDTQRERLVVLKSLLPQLVTNPGVPSISISEDINEKISKQYLVKLNELLTSPDPKESGFSEHDYQVLQEAYQLHRMGSFAGKVKLENEDLADEDVKEMSLPTTREELLQLCKTYLADQPSMIVRNFEDNTNVSSSMGYGQNEQTIRVMQWNILAQTLGEKSDKFVCTPDALNWYHRRWRILEEIVSYNADIVCLQEVDHFKFLSTMLKTIGMQGTFVSKPDSPCCYIKGNNGPDGCAIFYDESKYTLLSIHSKVLQVFRCQSNQVVILCTFERKCDGRHFCVATTHLKARTGNILPTLRNEQGKDLLSFLELHNPSDRPNKLPCIVTGDFNAEPIEPVYRTMTESGNFKSSYAENQTENSDAGEEPSYTTWKIREGDGEICHTIDYIFHNQNGFNVAATLAMPTGDQIGAGRVPSLTYPSDHFSLCADLHLPS